MNKDRNNESFKILILNIIRSLVNKIINYIIKYKIYLIDVLDNYMLI
jgi:hypothetical protein